MFLFDLDGTLIDTAPDLAAALNAVLKQYHRPELPLERIRPYASEGSAALIQLGFQIEPDQAGFEKKRRALLDYYHRHICVHSRLFPGMETVLSALQNQPWGIVTNKPAWLTQPLLEQIQWPCFPRAVISGDSCTHRKPHPEPLLRACRQLKVNPFNMYYVGDAWRDILAGKRAGMCTVFAEYGYTKLSKKVDHRIQQPIELLNLMYSL